MTKDSKSPSESSTAKRASATRAPAKRMQDARKTAAKKATARTSAVSAPAAKPVRPAKKATASKTAKVAKPSKPQPTSAVPRKRTQRSLKPILDVVRRPDGRALSLTERLAEEMHKRLGHEAAVCHRCRLNASQLASLAASA